MKNRDLLLGIVAIILGILMLTGKISLELLMGAGLIIAGIVLLIK